MMFGWIVGVPVFLMAMVLVLDRLEERVVAPVERMARIRDLVHDAEPEVVEREVAMLLGPTVNRVPSGLAREAS